MAKPRQAQEEIGRLVGEAMLGVDRAVSAAATGKDRPPGEMIELWLGSKLLQASGLAPQRQPAASAAQIAAAEARLGWPLPEQLRDFYRASNGIAWSAVAETGGYFPALDRLSTAGKLVPPLSLRQEAHWRKYRAKPASGGRSVSIRRGFSAFSGNRSAGSTMPNSILSSPCSRPAVPVVC